MHTIRSNQEGLSLDQMNSLVAFALLRKLSLPLKECKLKKAQHRF